MPNGTHETGNYSEHNQARHRRNEKSRAANLGHGGVKSLVLDDTHVAGHLSHFNVSQHFVSFQETQRVGETVWFS
jgi:hypothetical protein